MNTGLTANDPGASGTKADLTEITLINNKKFKYKRQIPRFEPG